MAVFNLLAEPDRYVPCSTENMLVDHDYRAYWLRHFGEHFNTIVRLAIENYGEAARERAAGCHEALKNDLRLIAEKPDRHGRLDLLVLDMLRQERLIEFGLPDPFELAKTRENEVALALYPQIVAELDSHHSEEEALLLAVEGIFAGNIFDLGAGATTKLFAHASPDFIAVRDGLGGKRPWLVDHYEAFARRTFAKGHRKCVFFCDNAGSDCLLGVMPFCRLLAQRGTQVLIAANRLPALNDMTVAELRKIMPRLCAIDPVLNDLYRRGRIAVIDSGGVAPLIDLREISDELNAHSADADLVVLEGMGRGLESNFEARFRVDALKLCMIKEDIVARRHNGKIFDTVFRFDAA